MTGAETIDDLRKGFLDPPVGSAPMMRWWWFGPAVDRGEIDRELTVMAGAGLGGVEVAYVYPLSTDSDTFLSPEFLADLRYAADAAHELGLRFDLTLGSGWSFGGPHITAEYAARKLHWERREISPGSARIPVNASWPGDELVAAYLGSGSLQEPPEELSQLPVVDGSIEIPDGTGTRQVLLAYAQLTGQNVKRAAFGAEGPVLDHYSATAAQQHLRHVGDRLLDAVPRAPARLGVLRQPRGVRERLDPGSGGGVPGPARLRPTARAVPAGRRRSRRDPIPGRLPPNPGRPVRGQFRRRLPALGGRARGSVPDPELRHAAGHGQQLPPRRPVRGRGLGVDRPHPDQVGVLGGAPVRARRRVVGDLDLGALAVLPGDAARPQGGGAPAPARRHQPVHRSRLALHPARRPRVGLALLRLRRARRPESVVAVDGTTGGLPDAALLADAPGRAGLGRAGLRVGPGRSGPDGELRSAGRWTRGARHARWSGTT